MGDNLTGEGEGDDEQIVIDLDRVPSEYDKIVIVVTIYQAQQRKQHFGLIEIPAETFLTKSYPVEFRFADLLAVLAAFAAVAVLLSGITVRSMLKNNE